MLLHIIPRLYTHRGSEPPCELIDFHCPALGLRLRNGIDIVARRPFPNKNYQVACRKIGQKAWNGFMIETNERVREFTTLTRWAVGGERVVNHQVQYIILDDEFDAISGDMLLWHGTSEWSQRYPQVAEQWSPASAHPRMELTPSERNGHYADRLDSRGRIVERSEVFQVHTLERERIQNVAGRILSDRIPPTEPAFPAIVVRT
ncbi:hypothetical protein UM91_22020 [Pseudomonas oryzihabitans]|uniref:DUF6012 family protein n=1 Tax=Pseudomonas oryzihabitans TaxID=47885 RepID=UPI0005CAFD60|nr:DUF6012 family protein [Pseudomonas oryzihabitans]KIZ48457.1 hypothetical protein UM91_22020 [Pseudomonas oryzihabitans]